MAKNIEPNLKLISEYLKLNSNEIFEIPAYQRAYSWNITQCDKLWQDIEEYIDNNIDSKSGITDPYFFGTIICDCSNSADNYLSLIDGQQRTITFILLIKALLLRLQEALDLFKCDEDSEALEEGLKDNRNLIIQLLYKADVEKRVEILRNWDLVKDVAILKNDSINELDDFKMDLPIILKAKNYQMAEDGVHKIPRKQKDNKYTNFFRNFKYFYERLGEYKESQLNNFSKTFLRKCQIIEIRSWNVDQAITMFNSLNSTGLPLSDADIISAQLYLKSVDEKQKFQEQWKRINKSTSELSLKKIVNIDSVLQEFMYIKRAKDKEYINNGSTDVTTPGLRNYYTILNRDLLEKPFQLCDAFEKITKIWEQIQDYPIVRLLLKFNENAKLYLISYLYDKELTDITVESVLDITECLLRLFAVLELVDAGYSSSNFKTFLFTENIKFVESGHTISEIKADFNTHINKSWKEDDIRQSILDYDKNILVFLNEYLYCKEKGFKDFNFSENVNIEHIMPASGHNLDSIRKDAGIESMEDFDSIVNKLGNKILLEEDINKSIGKEWFQTKKQKSIMQKSGYKDSKYKIAHALIYYPKDLWLKDDIETATNKNADRIIDFIFEK